MVVDMKKALTCARAGRRTSTSAKTSTVAILPRPPMLNDRFFVWREECWGGTHVYQIFERRPDGRFRVGKPFNSRTSADGHCAQMNADWEQYQIALAEGNSSKIMHHN